MTRQAASNLGFREEQTQSLELLSETEETNSLSEPVLSAEPSLGVGPSRRLGHYAFVLMCVGGMIVVWLYSSGKNMLDPSALTSLVARTGIQSIFTDPVQVGVVSIIALITAVWVALRRRASRFQLPI